MSVRYEWVDAAGAHVEYVPERTDVHNGRPGEGDEYDTEDRPAIIISGDEATVLHGSVESLRALAERMLAVLPPV